MNVGVMAYRGKDTIPAELLHMHYEEVAALQSAFRLDPDWERYDRLNDEGKLVFIAATLTPDALVPAGAMVGYMACIVEPHLHYKDTIVAIGDVHYVLPFFRRRGLAVRMISTAEAEAKARGAKFFVLRSKVDHPHGDLYANLGYKPLDTVHLKEL